MKQKATLLEVALSKPAPPVGPPPKARRPDLKRRIPLSHDQCAYCKEKGHWKMSASVTLRRKPKQQVQYQPKPPSANLIGLAGAESKYGGLGSLQLGPQEPMIRIKVGGHPMDFMVDTGAEHSVSPSR